MACYTQYDNNRKAIGFICGKLGKRCDVCGDVGGYLCDYRVGGGKMCSKNLCEYCANEVGIDKHYCPEHHATHTLQSDLFMETV